MAPPERPLPPRSTNDEPDEESPLLTHSRNASADREARPEERKELAFGEDDPENPRAWPRPRKMANVAVIAMMALLSPMASSIFTPAIPQIARTLSTTEDMVIACTTGYTVMLGIGPLVLAPLSETFGRRPMYLICFSLFTLIQIPTALAPNISTLIALRVFAGFFGSVGISNGGGTISDMFDPSERAGVTGVYLLGPLLGPTLGPLCGGTITQRLSWRWMFVIMAIVGAINTLAGFIFLRETRGTVLLDRRKRDYEQQEGTKNKYYFEGQDERPLWRKMVHSWTRPVRIFFQPIIITMSLYQALIFSTTYSLYTNMESIYGKRYGFNTEQVGFTYFGPGSGFLIAVWFFVPRIDSIFNWLTKRNDGVSEPEFRLPLAQVGAFLLPASLFAFAWTVEYEAHWAITVAILPFYAISQVLIGNCVQNYYIDSFEKYAASAIAAGAVFRSVIGGVVPLFSPALFRKLGFGWGISVFAFLGILLAPAPAVFYFFGARIRRRFTVEL